MLNEGPYRPFPNHPYQEKRNFPPNGPQVDDPPWVADGPPEEFPEHYNYHLQQQEYNFTNQLDDYFSAEEAQFETNRVVKNIRVNLPNRS